MCNKHFVLCIYNSTKLIQLETNVNDLIIKVYFTQKYDNKKYPIVYYSKKLSKMEQNYNIHNKKLLAIIEVFKQWQQYCKKTPKLDIYINHKNFEHFMTTKILNQQQICWMEFLSEFDLTIHYTPKRENG